VSRVAVCPSFANSAAKAMLIAFWISIALAREAAAAAVVRSLR